MKFHRRGSVYTTAVCFDSDSNNNSRIDCVNLLPLYRTYVNTTKKEEKFLCQLL